MQKTTSHSKTNLFLIEMLFSLLFLSLACTVCIQIFAAARSNRQEARQWNHIQELTLSTGELLEGSDGTPEAMLSLLPGGILEGRALIYPYDSSWQVCSLEKASVRMEIQFFTDKKEKGVELSFRDHSDTTLYELTIRYPVLSGKEAIS